MKKYVVIFLTLLITLSMIGCASDRIEVGVEDGKAYFQDWGKTPDIILKGENEIVIRDDSLFYKVMALISGKPAVEDMCNCEAVYTMYIKEYTFGLHTHGIVISKPMGRSIKGVKVFSVDCTEEEMNELFDILKSAK